MQVLIIVDLSAYHCTNSASESRSNRPWNSEYTGLPWETRQGVMRWGESGIMRTHAISELYWLSESEGMSGNMQQSQTPISVGIVDNDPCALRILTAIVATIHNCRLLWTCSTGATAIQRCLSRQGRTPDVLIVDMSLDDMPGTTVCETVRTISRNITVIAITAYSAHRYQDASSRAGAYTLITKDHLNTALPKVIHDIANGFPTGTIPHSPERSISHATSSEEHHDYDKALSEREQKTLGLYAEGYSTRDIATTMNISESTVYSYQNRAVSKLHARNLSHAIALGARKGLW
ncbi:response regulator transcription factor [Bifidobacterium tissieri]|uniref:Response regulator transcription factor n=1 Tax=Bifidobacterium tissieri TaxID=1630162 RepID=A0A5M9ZSN4_9BIFI|nr:response regulator transcription factor [Bifidobacterium tissieri]KAA8830469.1 response regulator transcription factor [Bifidobacterium tissieri]